MAAAGQRAARAALACGAGACLADDASSPPRELERIASEIPRQETGSESDHATGDWGGLRTRLVEHGVHFYAGYAGEVFGNVSGGLRRGAVYEGLLEFGLDLDSEKLGLWQGGLLHVTSLNTHGSGLSGRHSGDLLTASNIDAYDSLRLYELWYEHRFWNDRWSIRAGQSIADEEFSFTSSGGDFLNSAFGWPAFISANVVNTGPAFFVATPGARLRWDATEALYFQSGVYDGDSFDDASGNPRVNRSGMHVHLNSDQGMFAIGEAGYRWNSAANTAGLPGSVKAGAWLHTGDFPSNFHDENGGQLARTGLAPRTHAQTFGAYLAGEQMIWREQPEEEQGVWIFGRVGGAPRDRAFFEFAADFGLSFVGLLPGRDEDILGLGFVHARISRDLRAFERLDSELSGAPYAAFSDHESVLEAFYSFRPTDWWSIQPDIQWIVNPGGSAALSDALVVGIRTSIVF